MRICGQYHHLDGHLYAGRNPQGFAPFRYLFLNYWDARICAEHAWMCELPACTREAGEEEKRISSLYELRLQFVCFLFICTDSDFLCLYMGYRTIAEEDQKFS